MSQRQFNVRAAHAHCVRRGCKQCDPQSALYKRMARHWSTRAPTNRFCKAHEFYTYINDTLQKPDTRYRSRASAGRLGIYRRLDPSS
jgi:hypothetical protein